MDQRPYMHAISPVRWVEPADMPAAARTFLHPGRVFASAQPTIVSTVLGSCVSVCLFDPDRRVGGANHFLLPRGPEQGPEMERFAPGAIAALVAQLEALGSPTRNLRAKVFGGACVMEAFQARHHLGTANVEAAEALLRQTGVPVVGRDVGGQRGRRVVFHTGDGAAWVRQI